MRHIVCINEEQASRLEDIFNDPLLDDVEVGREFSITTLKTIKWKNGDEIIEYCKKNGIPMIGEGLSRVVFLLSDEKVLKVEKGTFGHRFMQNCKEVDAYRACDDGMRQFVPYIYDYDKDNVWQ